MNSEDYSKSKFNFQTLKKLYKLMMNALDDIEQNKQITRVNNYPVRNNKILGQQVSNMIKSIEGYSYKINEHIGKGYSSTVHKGKNDLTGQQVSIKVIEMAKLEDPINHMLLQYEVAALKALAGSSHILHLYDVYATKNNTYLITELMQGDLHTLLKQKKQFPYYEACEVIKQIIEGYFEVYKQGYLHRDIKPANIFHKNGVYKIGDFGFAIPAKDSNQHKTYNVGSPVYMPPEALKENNFSYSCDTWAIGIIFFQLLKGLVPWRAISEPKLYQKIINEPLSDLTIGLPEVARNFLSRLLHIDPLQRMTPQELVSWPGRLFAVEIRSMTPAHGRPTIPKCALQEIYHNNNLAQNYSRSKSYSSNQVPNYVSGLRVNLISNQNSKTHLNQNENKLSQNHLVVPPFNPVNNVLSQINIPSSLNSGKLPLPHLHQFSQKSSTIFSHEQQKQFTLTSKQSSIKTPQQYAQSMISYIKFIYRVIKFIGNPTQVPLKDLQLSLTKTLFKEIELIKRLFDSQNCEVFNVPGWKFYISTAQCQQKFIKSINNLVQKYKMFHPLPDNQFILQVYKQQIIDGICKISELIKKQQKLSQKVVLSLDLLVRFYEVWNYKSNEQMSKFDFAKFLDIWNFQKTIQQNPYELKENHMNQVQIKIKSLGLESTPTKIVSPHITTLNFNQPTLRIR